MHQPQSMLNFSTTEQSVTELLIIKRTVSEFSELGELNYAKFWKYIGNCRHFQCIFQICCSISKRKHIKGH